jgi:CobQ-like glutamine amidotransferase family enzyme
MIVEILFNEVCNLYGDGQNVTYLQATLPDAQFIFTALTDQPYFSDNRPDMIYIGSMSEATQRRVIEKLLPLKDRIHELVDSNVLILATGNAGEIFTKHISYVTEKVEVDALGVADFTVKTNLFDRYNGKVLGTFEDLDIVGFRSQFSFLYGDNDKNYFVKCTRGIGINRQSSLEGFRVNNLFVTQILGPILPLNPLFCERLIALTGNSVSAAYRDDAIAAYEQRLAEFRDPKTIF